MVKISSFMIGLVLLGVMVTSLYLFAGGLALEYGVSSEETNSTFYNDIVKNTAIEANKTQSKLESITPDSSITDRLGAFLGAGYDAVLLVGGSLGVFFTAFNFMATALHVPTYVIGAGVAIIIILIFVAIILSVLVKREM